MIEYIQAILLIISAILIIISAIGLITLDKNMKNSVYARIHIVGIFDIACIIAMIAMGRYLLAVIYFIIANKIVASFGTEGVMMWRLSDYFVNGEEGYFSVFKSILFDIGPLIKMMFTADKFPFIIFCFLISAVLFFTIHSTIAVCLINVFNLTFFKRCEHM